MPELKVTLLTYTPEPQKIMAAAAKLCYARADIDTVMEGLTPEKTEGFIDMLSGLGHESPMEHMNFTFGIENVSPLAAGTDYAASPRLLQRTEPAVR